MKAQNARLKFLGQTPVCPIHIFVHFNAGLIEKIRLAKADRLSLYFIGDHEKKDAVTEWFTEYFSGNQTPFPLPLSQGKVPPFTWRVLEELQKIPHGKQLSYSDVAANVGNEKAARAVGNACRVNPFPIVVPCHRVVKGDGSLGGFAYGLQMKMDLLNIERLETL